MIRLVLVKRLILSELYLDQSLRSPEPIELPNYLNVNQIYSYLKFCIYAVTASSSSGKSSCNSFFTANKHARNECVKLIL